MPRFKRGMTSGVCVSVASPRYVRRYRQPLPVLLRPAIGVAPAGLLAVGCGVAGPRMDDGEIAEDANLDVFRLEIFDRHRHRGLLEKCRTVDQRFVGIGAVKILGED